MGLDQAKGLDKCKDCGDLIEGGQSCLSCIYFKTNHPGEDISEIVEELGNYVRGSATELTVEDKITCSARLLDLEGELEGELGINVPGVKGLISIKYEITIQRGFEVSAGDVKPIDNISLFFNRATSQEDREKTRPYKGEIFELVKDAFHGKD